MPPPFIYPSEQHGAFPPSRVQGKVCQGHLAKKLLGISLSVEMFNRKASTKGFWEGRIVTVVFVTKIFCASWLSLLKPGWQDFSIHPFWAMQDFSFLSFLSHKESLPSGLCVCRRPVLGGCSEALALTIPSATWLPGWWGGQGLRASGPFIWGLVEGEQDFFFFSENETSQYLHGDIRSAAAGGILVQSAMMEEKTSKSCLETGLLMGQNGWCSKLLS